MRDETSEILNPVKSKSSGVDKRKTIFNMVPNCRAEKCPLFNDCAYEKNTTTKCGPQRDFIRQVSEPFFVLLDKYPDDFLAHQIGLRLIPLYHQLAKLQMREASIPDVVYSHDGELKPHPIYKMILDCMNAIRREWKDTGLTSLVQKLGYLNPPDPLSVPKFDTRNGMSGYYEEMSKTG